MDISLSILADLIGHASVALAPIHALIEGHVLAAKRLYGDDTTVPLHTRSGTKTARLWTYVRDDRPFDGGAPPAALFYLWRDREGQRPEKHLGGWQGVLQSDVYASHNGLYLLNRDPGTVICTFCWSHSRRKFFELTDIDRNVRKNKPAHDISPAALEAVQKIDAIFNIERELNGLSVPDRHAARQELVLPLVENLYIWLVQERAKMSKHNPVAKAINYMIQKAGRWEAFTAFLDDGQICLTNNAAESALRGVALGRKSWLFAGSERGGDRAALPGSRSQTTARHARLARARAPTVELENRSSSRQGRIVAVHVGCLRILRLPSPTLAKHPHQQSD